MSRDEPAEIGIYITSETLDDGSDVFTVQIGHEPKEAKVFPCISENDAVRFANGISALIENHTGISVDVVDLTA